MAYINDTRFKQKIIIHEWDISDQIKFIGRPATSYESFPLISVLQTESF